MKFIKTLILTFILLLPISLLANSKNINKDWKFILEDIAEAKESKYNDSNWEVLTLPHDWSFEAGYFVHGAQKDKGGYGIGGIAWYRKELSFSKSDLKDKNIFIDFDAVYMNSEVWINGHYLGKRPYGYISFSYDLTPYLTVGDNLISVRVDNSLDPSARWYHGCGIYGNVFLREVGNTYLEKDGITITTPVIASESASVNIKAEVVSTSTKGNYTLSCTLYDNNGIKVGSVNEKEFVAKEGVNIYEMDSKVLAPNLWSPESPYLYSVELLVKDSNNKILDSKSLNFGFRTIEWEPKTGLYLNGEQYKLRGVCEHLEGGPTGAYFTEKLLRWRLQKIKDMGCNAIRVAHNPYLPVFYDICDEIGLLVMDEIFDGWNKKADYDYGMQAFDEWWERDVRAWIRRDKNHPSVFLYSIGNETHGDIAPEIVKVCHEEDNTRLVTSGDCNPLDMDVYGVNGRSEKKSFLDTYTPDKAAFIATENPHTWQVRGYYRTMTWYRDGFPNTKQEPQVIPNLTEKEIFGYDWTSPKGRMNRKQIFNSSYDNATVRVTARHLIEALATKEWFSGSFRWTGYDYRGEAGYVHGGWPFRAFQSGALDLAGFEKDLFYLYQSEWGDKDMVHILPHWTHPKMPKGELIPVWVYTSGDEVELIVNGKSLGKKQKGSKWNQMQCEWLVPWKEGVVEAIAYRNGVEIARTSQKSSGAPEKLSLELSSNNLMADKEDITILTIEQQDSNGTLYPYGENRVYTKLFGGARVLSFENGSPVDTECNFEATSKECFFGLNRIFIQSTDEKANKPVSIITAAICGDKKLMLSNKISIDLQEIALRGVAPKRNFTIRYTTNGDEPTLNSKLYKGAFEINLGTIVKAAIFDDNVKILSLEEKFTEEDGLYWGTPGEKVFDSDGDQAEQAKLENGAFFQKKGDSFFATGYVSFRKKGASVTWYQENDGGAFNASMSIRYSQLSNSAPTKMELWNNDKLIKVLDFTNTGSASSHWREYAVNITINSGANNIKLVSLGGIDNSPNIDQISIIQ